MVKKAKTQTRKTKVIGVPLQFETINFFKAQAQAERRPLASVMRIHLEDIVAAARQTQQPAECSQ